MNTFKPDEDEAIVLALAELSFSRPGWRVYLKKIAAKFTGGEARFNYYTELRVKAVAHALTGEPIEEDEL